MKRLLSLILMSFTLGALALAAPALAQDEPEPAEAPEDDPGGLLEGSLLEEKKPVEQPVLDDPDAKLLKEVEAARTALEKRLNPLQEKVVAFPKIDKAMQKIMADWLKSIDGFVEPHATALSAYRAAIKDNRETEKKAQAKVILKARDGFLKAIKKISKSVDGLEKNLAKETAKAEKE